MRIGVLQYALLTKFFVLIQVVLLIVFTIMSDIIVTGFSSLDIYRHSDQEWYILLNPTFLEILETTILLACYYALR